jgi:hypothetical protein
MVKGELQPFHTFKPLNGSIPNPILNHQKKQEKAPNRKLLCESVLHFLAPLTQFSGCARLVHHPSLNSVARRQLRKK